MFNGEKYIIETLESVESQTYPNLELVISDDSSEDGSLKLISDFVTRTNLTSKVVLNPKGGIGENWNNCIHYARGKYIKFVFQDDVLAPECIERMVAIAEQDDKVGFVYSDRSIIMDFSEVSHQDWFRVNGHLNRCWARPLDSGIYPGRRLLKDRNLFLIKPLNKIGEPSSILYRRSVFDAVGLFDTSLIQLLDLEFSLRVLARFKFGYLKENLSSFRLHKDQASNHFGDKNINERSLILKSIPVQTFIQMSWTSMKLVLAQRMPVGLERFLKFRSLIRRCV